VRSFFLIALSTLLAIRVENPFERWPRVAADHPLLCV
jgi:hypothetical protein